MSNRHRLELPPTGGLPLQWRDLLPARSPPLAEHLAQFIGVDHLQLTCSGTAALVIALTALIERAACTTRREVVIPAFTCPLVAMAIVHCGLEAVLCDVRPDHFDFDPIKLAALCSERTLAIIPTHLGGRLANVDAAMAVAHDVGAWIIEDAAQSMGARHGDGTAAGLRGDIGIFSMAVGKGLTLYEGGALVTRDPALRESIQNIATRLAPYRWAYELRRSIELLGYAVLYHPRLLYWVYGRPLRQALRVGDMDRATGDIFPATIPLHSLGAWRRSVGFRALHRLPAHLEVLREQAQVRLPRLCAIAGLQVLLDDLPAQGTWPVLLLLLPDRAARDAVLTKLWPAGVGVSRLFAHALPDYACLRETSIAADTPNARDFAARSMTITNSPWLDEATFGWIADTIEQVCDQARSDSAATGERRQ